MQFNLDPTKCMAVDGGAERCCALQSAVAFWIVLICTAIGCRQSNTDQKYQVGSSSMAPTWFGPHLEAVCVRCGQHSLVVQEAYDPVIPTRCFSCGGICECKNDLHPGEVLKISRYAANASLKRFDVVTFDTPANYQAESPQTLKRVWALPGEHLELHNGEAWIDGKRLQKSARELATVGIPLSCFPKDNRSHWWVVDSSESEPTRIEIKANQGLLQLEKSQRLEFRYARPNRNPESPEMLPSQIVDDFPCNQNSVAQLHEVPDFLLAIELDEPLPTDWTVCLQSMGKYYSVRVASKVRGTSTSAEVEGADRLLIAVCDGRLLVSTESHVTQWELDEVEEISDPADGLRDSLITITTTETLRIKRLLVARDHWLGPREGRSIDWVPIGSTAEIETEVARGYFVLGDNLQLSLDSRDAKVGRIAPERITGKVKRFESAAEWIRVLLERAFRDIDGD